MDPALLQNETSVKAEGIWTLDSTIYEQFGKRGWQLAEENMQQLVELCQRPSHPHEYSRLSLAGADCPTRSDQYPSDILESICAEASD